MHPFSPGSRPTSRLCATILSGSLALALGGCGDHPSAPRTRSVTVTVSSVLVVGDCESTGGNHGDFTYELVVVDPGVEPANQLRFSGSFPGVSGDPVDLPDIAFTMRREAKPGDAFTLLFRVTEWDAAMVADPRMNEVTGERVHAWTSGADWANGAHAMDVDGGPECGVRFSYSVAAR